MEAVKESVPAGEAVQEAEPVLALALALGLLRDLGPAAVADAPAWGFCQAAGFAADVEELSRAVEYLQLVAAGAVDRIRNQGGPAVAEPSRTATGWTTGWCSAPDAVPDSAPNSVLGSAPCGAEPAPAELNRTGETGPATGTLPVPADDGFRNTAEFLRVRLRISIAEARRRLALAGTVLSRAGTAGQQLPPEREELGQAVAVGTIASHAATIISTALDRVRHTCDTESSARMEHALTLTAASNDPDFLARIARRWTEALDQDGAEPSEEALRRLQGAFIRRVRGGLHHLEIFATADQFEHLLTVMNTATNPRTTSAISSTSAGPGPGPGSSSGDSAALDRRSRPQKLLDGLVGACKAALASGGLPAAGGLRPQVMVTIDYRDLLVRLGQPGTAAGSQARAGSRSGGDPRRRSPRHTGTLHSGTLMFTGPVTAVTIRKIACDADIIPVLLGTGGRILDIGRASRLFPPHLRKAITARDRGCAFPNCTIPAPWCEAHHISYWSHGGTTGTENGVLLCTHHHHLIHKEQWTIQVHAGIPWFIPPPHLDPHQEPKRNHYFRS